MARKNPVRDRLQYEVDRLRAELYELEWHPAMDTDFSLTIDAEHIRDQLNEALERLGNHDSRTLIAEAMNWGVEVPDSTRKPEWYSEEIKRSKADTLGGTTKAVIVRPYLNRTGAVMIMNQIREAKLEYWRNRTAILVPILALIVAILALCKDIIITLLKQR